ncbi:riboflavin kinase/FMN adenylyltransferase [Microbacterium endophyticum]|uniref:Riboflavin biosynthesis protein n=1 Tax=Microbacterium endophyticum TaxID=1526412 RepID=A0A7W4V356_9MICO|nr:bifunctional riboflavin kinase/FAD synthetase [Microbacterium endophyticum]MBB2976018.1 riboflavin kinase/FMN adenylyltransferase [Microbacterium endophyticum]NIK35063.1 riboflavin kinase/FMN adenylyltransferase [Microbacterium endophyticum]
MILFRDPSEIPVDFGPSVVAIGKFDGVHAGHRAVIERARVDAASAHRKVVAVTFDRNPLSLLRPDLCPRDVSGVTQKIQQLAETGVDATLMLTFDEELAEWEPREFVERVLVQPLRTRTVLVGQDFRFGRGGAGTPEVLAQLGEEFGFRVDVVEDVRAIDVDRRVSSTWIRELLAEGDVTDAAKLLGRPASVWGEVVHGLKRGRELGFPTANLSPELEGFVPADGVYAGWLVDEGSADGLRSGTRYPAAISVGTNPTFDDVHKRQVEAYVLDETDLDLYGHRVEVQFVERVRGMIAFNGIEALIEQMTKDVSHVRSALS